MYDQTNYLPQNSQIQFAQQAQRQEIAKIQQIVVDLEQHIDEMEARLSYIARTMQTQEESLQYANLLLQINKTKDNLISHVTLLRDMMRTANFSFGKSISEQAKREIYHLYHARRYNQVQLAEQYHITQGAVSKIVNGPSPEPLTNA